MNKKYRSRKGGRGLESLVKWNLVTDAREGGAVLRVEASSKLC